MPPCGERARLNNRCVGQSDCQKKCAADENCKAYTSCTDLTENYHCDSYNTEICELKTWASGPAVLDGPGDGWYSASRANFT